MGLLAKENPNRDDLDISTYKVRNWLEEIIMILLNLKTEVYWPYVEMLQDMVQPSGMMVSITKAGLLGIDSNDPEFMLKTLNRIIKKVDIGRLRMSLNLFIFRMEVLNLVLQQCHRYIILKKRIKK